MKICNTIDQFEMNLSPLQCFLSQQLQTPVIKIQSVGGGCINQTYKIITASNQFFCKTNSASKFPHLLEKEKKGLELIQKHGRIKTPSIINYSVEADEQILILEWIEEDYRKPQFWKNFGEELADLHTISGEYFGLEENNFMGSVPQNNRHQKNWISFFIEQRLQPLKKLCIDNHLLKSKHIIQFEILYKHLPVIFNEEKPSLLHGDLWSGNFMCAKESKPVLIDPAVYFGHRSADLAMTTLFGGFGKSFYEAYHYHFPFPDNYREQWEICNLYPLLIHLFLFGRSYLHQVEEVLNKYSA